MSQKRWLLEEHLPLGSIRWQCFEHEYQCFEAANSSEHPTTITALVPETQDSGGRYVELPHNADHAEMMERLGYAYLKQHAPERLKEAD